MYPEDEQLALACRSSAEVALEAAAWVDDNRQMVRNEAEGLLDDLKKAARNLRKWETAARRKMCVGVFGPSQSGKSYLVSSLAKDESGLLTADFNGKRINFLSDINPDGGKESTGLVTRFTLSQPPLPLPEHPVHLGLLSETDIVKILANTFCEDFIHKQAMEPEAITAALHDIERFRRPAPVGGLRADDVAELREYLSPKYDHVMQIKNLRHVFWPAAMDLAPYLEAQDRARLFGLIWNNVEPLGKLYLELQRILAQLGFAATAYCSLEALYPKKDGEDPISIIDVSTWTRGGKGDQMPLELVAADGKRRARVSRALVTALVAEVTIVMAAKPDDFFDHTDLLDFPGYRSRQKFGQIHKDLENQASLRECFLRGKVAYLFERYCADRELTSMLLCVDDQNQEVQSLPEVIDAWVRATQGETPEKRGQKRDKVLFLVLTKMDRHFGEKQGALDTASSRWTTRLQTSLLDFFGKGSEWPAHWDQRGPFDNIFWMRNTGIENKSYFEYDPDDLARDIFRETGIRAGEREYLEKLRAGFLENAEVVGHFGGAARAAQAWDAALTVGDGGITFLRQQLRPVCRPEIKRRQIEDNLSELGKGLIKRLKPYYKSDNLEEARLLLGKQAKSLSGVLAMCAEAQRFGELLRCLQVTDQELYDLFFQVPVDPQEARAGQEADSPPDLAPPPVTTGRVTSADSLLGDIFGNQEAQKILEPVAEKTTKASGRIRDEASSQAGVIEKYWIAKLRALADNQQLQAYFSPSLSWDANLFVHHLVVGGHRLGIWQQVESELRQAASYSNIRRDKLVWKQVSRAAMVINTFVDWLGLAPRQVPESRRQVTVGARQLQVFQSQPPVEGYPILGEDPAAHERTFFRDWIATFFALMNDNLDFDGVTTTDPVQNQHLGRIIQQLGAPVDPGVPSSEA